MRQRLKLLNKNTGFIKYLQNTSWLISEKILRMIVGLFVGVWVARYLGPEQFGLYSYAQSFVGLFASVATLGLDSIVVRELVKDESRRDQILGTVFCLKLAGACIVFFLLAIAVNLTSNDNYTKTLIFIIASATVFQSFNVIDYYYQAKVLGKYIAYANVISLLLSSIIKIILILQASTLTAFAWVVAFDSFILAIGYVYVYANNNFSIKAWKYDSRIAASLLKDSYPLILSAIVISIYMKIDQVMIKEMLNMEAVGQYAAAVRISEAWYFIPMVIASSLFPAIVNAKKVSKELYNQRIQSLCNLMVWLAVAIALPVTFYSDWIIHILYGNQYDQAAGVLTLHIWAGVFVFLGVASSHWLINENYVFIAFYRNLVGAIGSIVLNIYIIPAFGIRGAACSTLFAWALSAFLFDLILPKTRTMFQIKFKALCFNLIK